MDLVSGSSKLFGILAHTSECRHVKTCLEERCIRTFEVFMPVKIQVVVFSVDTI